MSSGQLRRRAGLDDSAGQQMTVAESVRDLLIKNTSRMQALLPKGMTPERFIQIAYTSIRKTPKLLECSKESLLGAVTDAARLGLEVGVNGQAFLVPYKGVAQCVPGWRGLITLVARTGRATAWTEAVFEGDDFEWEKGTRPYIRHRPCGEDDPARITHVYAVGHITGTEYPVIEVWTIERVWRHRDRFNKVGDKHYSFEHPEMYARKTVLLQVLKHLPMSPEAQAAVEMANYEDRGQPVTLQGDFTVAPPVPEPVPDRPMPVQEPPPEPEPEPEPSGPALQAGDEYAAELDAGEPDPMDAFFADVAKAADVPALVKLKGDFKTVFPDATKEEQTKLERAIAARIGALA